MKNNITQNESCLNFHKQLNRNSYSYGQYGCSAINTYYVYKKGSKINDKAIKTFKFSKENKEFVLSTVYKFLDFIGKTKIFDASKKMNSFSVKKKIVKTVTNSNFNNQQGQLNLF